VQNGKYAFQAGLGALNELSMLEVNAAAENWMKLFAIDTREYPRQRQGLSSAPTNY